MPAPPEPQFTEHSPGHAEAGTGDVIDHRPESVIGQLKRPSVLVSAVLVALVAGLAVGYLAGTDTSRSGQPATKTVTREVTAPPPAPSSGPFNQIITTGSRCSTQTGHRLELGIEVRNELDHPVTLVDLRVPYHAGDQLRPLGTSRGACGQLPGADTGIGGYRLGVGQTVWLTVTVEVLTGCPTPLHLTLLLDYTQAGRPTTESIDGFPDLGGVPYTGCQ